MKKKERIPEAQTATDITINKEDAEEEAASQKGEESTETEELAEPSSEKKIESLQKEITELNDKWLRSVAETENTRKRAAKERQTAIRVLTDSILFDLLEVLDNFERAFTVSGQIDNHEEFVKGIKLIHHQFLDTLIRRGIKEIDVAGKPFDPDIHDAMIQVESDQPANTVVDVIQKGYMVEDRVLRHARVTVAK